MAEMNSSRRPLASRDKNWARKSASWLQQRGVQPNTISVFSTVFALLAAVALWASAHQSPRLIWLALVIVGVVGRLLCNLLDGMVAVEGGLKTASGEVFNDMPDRISDAVIFVAMGYAAASTDCWIQMGWAAALLAVATAYVRYLGAGCGVGHSYMGPMAKQHRMALTIAATFAAAIFEEMQIVPVGTFYRIALVAVVAGSLITCVRRTLRIVRDLETASPKK